MRRSLVCNIQKMVQNTPDAKQTSISTFFKRSEKRSSTSVEENAMLPSKVQKQDASSSLSPEQKCLITQKKKIAEEKLQQNLMRGVSGIGDSWRIALSTEFNKTYFQQVCF